MDFVVGLPTPLPTQARGTSHLCEPAPPSHRWACSLEHSGLGPESESLVTGADVESPSLGQHVPMERNMNHICSFKFSSHALKKNKKKQVKSI